MDNIKLEQELKTYFRCEAEAAAPSPDWWQSAMFSATSTRQEPLVSKPKTGFSSWLGNLVEILHINPQKPIWGIATYLLLLFVFVGLSAGLTDIISNFPPGGGSMPPATTQPPITTGTIPPTTTGPVPTGTVPPATTKPPTSPPITITQTNVTVAAAESAIGVYVIVFFLIFSFFVLTTVLVLTWRWKVARRNSI